MKMVSESKFIKSFLMIESVIYILFTLIDVNIFTIFDSQFSALLKFFSMIICALFVFVQIPYDLDNKRMKAIMLFTLSADYLLLFTEYFKVGILLFIVVQLLYSIRIHGEIRRSDMFIKVSLLICFSLGGYMMESIAPGIGILIGIGSYYALLFFWNIVNLIKSEASKYKQKRLFLIGLIFYAICDIHVAIYNFPTIFNAYGFLKNWIDFAAVGMWLFYLPGQVALALSIVDRKVKRSSINV